MSILVIINEKFLVLSLPRFIPPKKSEQPVTPEKLSSSPNTDLWEPQILLILQATLLAHFPCACAWTAVSGQGSRTPPIFRFQLLRFATREQPAPGIRECAKEENLGHICCFRFCRNCSGEEVSAPTGGGALAAGTVSSPGCPEDTLELERENRKSRTSPKFFSYERRPRPQAPSAVGSAHTSLPPTLQIGKSKPPTLGIYRAAAKPWSATSHFILHRDQLGA